MGLENSLKQPCVQLSVPAQQEMMLVVRLATAGVVTRAGLTLDSVDDVKMAVEEACHYLMRCTGCNVIRLCFKNEHSYLHAQLHGEECGCRDLVNTQPDEETILRCILESMVDSVCFQSDGAGGCIINMAKKLGE